MSEPVRVKITQGSEVLSEMEVDSFRHQISSNGHFALVALKVGQPRGAAEHERMLDLIFQRVHEALLQVPPPPGKRRALPRFEIGDEILVEVGEHNMVTESVGVDDQRVGEPIPDDLIVWRHG